MDYLDTKGRIFDVQKYSVHDGPGIRTIVFLKGCVLRCRWCCNPESQEYRIQNMKVLGEDKVIGRDVTVREMIEEVEKDRAYYYRSGGGITLSGGECMCQADFSRDLLRAAKERGINTAVESMACAPWEKIEQVLPYLDVYLIGAMAVYTFINAWNMYMWPLLVTGSNNMRTVQIGISMLDSVDSQSITLMIAGVVMIIIPSISIFIVGQKQLIRGMFSGAVKG